MRGKGLTASLFAASMLLALLVTSIVDADAMVGDFEAGLSAFRKDMIAACAQFQAGAPRESKAQFDQELAALQAAWASLGAEYRNAPPATYAGDAKWPSYFGSVSENLAAMRAAVSENRFGKAFEICGSTCAVFVTMHETNGISTVCDKLFEFRKQAKLMLAQIKSGHKDAAVSRLPSLLAQRDAAILVPLPPKAAQERDEYLRLRGEFSAAVDGFATALINDPPAAVVSAYDAMMQSFSRFYNRYI